ncbi:hypothetical protein PsYK624_098400 [Phanerochaete sordida]|uniref:Uncharacterized protein n=1 Tax=Phanerochaete sordida TaxID=48140 RepID=A0A9P3GF42_9APHY|nr:hypothetical protein PsYK624_098400 [Phanerochaete sordida]
MVFNVPALRVEHMLWLPPDIPRINLSTCKRRVPAQLGAPISERKSRSRSLTVFRLSPTEELRSPANIVSTV